MSCLDFKCTIDIKQNPLNLDINDFLDVALRNNNKRRFLFVSKSLGKHLSVLPEKVDNLGKLLAYTYKLKYADYKNEKQMVIGFAETATCLSHSFFNYLESAEFFIHTTREEVNGLTKLEFQEEHSHATEQNLYIDNLANVNKFNCIVLVDDEITTAKTCLNIIKKMQKKYNVEKYVVASILNWIDDTRKEEIEREAEKLNCRIEFVYIFNGKFNFEFDEQNELNDNIEKKIGTSNQAEINHIKLDFSKYTESRNYIKYTGRFGIRRNEQNELKEIIKREALKLKPKYSESDILALGIEEFMYIPMMLSKEIQGNVYYHSTTRSPIIPINEKGYPIKKKYSFESFYNKNVNYIYNLDFKNYKECFIFMEIDKEEDKINDFINILQSTGIERINIVKC